MPNKYTVPIFSKVSEDTFTGLSSKNPNEYIIQSRVQTDTEVARRLLGVLELALARYSLAIDCMQTG